MVPSGLVLKSAIFPLTPLFAEEVGSYTGCLNQYILKPASLKLMLSINIDMKTLIIHFLSELAIFGASDDIHQ